MPKLLPSQVAMAIDQLFGSARSELNDGMINGNHRAQVHTLVLLLDQIPDNLIDLPFNDFLEFPNCHPRPAGRSVSSEAETGRSDFGSSAPSSTRPRT